MIDLQEVTFRNFLSYGDYDTTIPLGKLGPCLIIGVNGAGKSTIVNAILYPFFGRTMHAPRPGDRVVNEETDKNCLVSARLKNGDVITRTRKMAGHNELVVERGGEAMLSTLSTTPNQQAQLNRLYDLDWYNFCNTSFLTQIGRPWFEMPDPQRKKEIERALRLDRLTLRAQVAKEKLEKTTQEQVVVRQKYDHLARQIDSATEDLTEAQGAETSFETERDTRIKSAIAQAREYKRRYDEMQVPDIVKLQKKWDALTEARTALATLEEKVRTTQTNGATALTDLRVRLRQAQVADSNALSAFDARLRKAQNAVAGSEGRVKEAERTIRLWKAKDGKVCTECEQSIPHSHTEDKITPYVKSRDEAAAEIEKHKATVQSINEEIEAYVSTATAVQAEIDAHNEALQKAVAKLTDKAAKLRAAIQEQTPDMSIREAKALIQQRDGLRDSAVKWAESAKAIKAEVNPHAATIQKLQKRIDTWTQERETIRADVERYDVAVQHYTYIHKSYNDRRKIKSFSVAKFRPLLNSRLRHYLEKFRLDINIEITDSLGVTTSGRSYEFMSGGERKRVDVSFMLARYDMQEALFGRQSNVLVLDEVDARMDDEGVECLKGIIFDDLAARVDAILVISHKESMRDAFPHQITVEKRGKFSLVTEIR